MNKTVFYIVMQFSLVNVYWCFAGTRYLFLHGTLVSRLRQLVPSGLLFRPIPLCMSTPCLFFHIIGTGNRFLRNVSRYQIHITKDKDSK
jgi:hypothetical protein